MTSLGRQEFTITGSFFLADEVYIRLRGGNEGQFQIHGYTYTSQLEGLSIPDVIGKTYYSDVLKSGKLPIERGKIKNMD